MAAVERTMPAQPAMDRHLDRKLWSPTFGIVKLLASQTTNACNDEGRCVPCGPEATAAPDAPDAQGQTVHDEEPPEEPHIEQPPKDVPAGDDDDRKKAKLPLPSGKYPLPSNSTMISKDGSCNEYISCVGSPFGVCCSTSGWCGYGKPWCGVGNCVSGHCDTEDEASGKPQ
ncbi:hypothetical protein TESG_06197 [Trichophyton tonsurans CBS 112818]|uniref:Chitin-binding type-1 domain-containing protein n=1 Tax=Trichophyton tonsurans (strain CBS 112818) TaxID=647933 RepID=F2S5I4_TRIT1|nr:hypothetical protein TESG_06197 [Trichophyton tonsurans CBS 112818]